MKLEHMEDLVEDLRNWDWFKAEDLVERLEEALPDIDWPAYAEDLGYYCDDDHGDGYYQEDDPSIRLEPEDVYKEIVRECHGELIEELENEIDRKRGSQNVN